MPSPKVEDGKIREESMNIGTAQNKNVRNAALKVLPAGKALVKKRQQDGWLWVGKKKDRRQVHPNNIERYLTEGYRVLNKEILVEPRHKYKEGDTVILRKKPYVVVGLNRKLENKKLKACYLLENKFDHVTALERDLTDGK